MATTAFGPAERADHALAGDRSTTSAAAYSARAEVYDKRFTELRPRFENIFDGLIIFPEVQGDRVRIAPQRGSARGGELLLRKTARRGR